MSRAASHYLHQFELISSPVPDLAATLTTQGNSFPNNDIISFLRTRLEGDTDLSLLQEQSLREESEDYDQWRQWDNRLAELRNIELAMSRRIPILREDEDSRYANRVPQRQSLYDWAPGSDDEDLYHELLSRANIPTFAQSARPTRRHLNLDSHGRSHSRSRVRPRDEEDGIRPPTWNATLQRERSPPRADSSSATAALLQSVEQHRRFNARARSTLQSYILERDRRNNDPVENSPTWRRVHRSELHPPSSPYPAVRNLSSQADMRDEYRSISLDHPSLMGLKHSICHLSKLRHCDTLEDGLALATDLTDGFSNLSDLIVDTASLPPVPECSWLTPGTVFAGSQHTPRDPSPVMLNRDRDRSHEPLSRPERFSPDPQAALRERQRRRSIARIGTYRDRLPVPDSTNQHRSFNADTNLNNQPHQQRLSQPSSVPADHWPVTITLHDISYSTLTLSGTMSAIHIPDKLCPPSPLHHPAGSSMRSFFEGEIVDFKTHTLETENFSTGDVGVGADGGVNTDARYWRAIGPFRELLEKQRAKRALGRPTKWHILDRIAGAGYQYNSDDTAAADDDPVEDLLGGEDIIAARLRSRSWIENVLLKEWVLMRWKERCFIKGTTSEGDAVQNPSTRSTGAGADAEARAGTAGTATSTAGVGPPSDPSSLGLTISGFYYVALRRQTGEIEGLYYDPGSLPFQVLDLRPECAKGFKARWPAQGFR